MPDTRIADVIGYERLVSACFRGPSMANSLENRAFALIKRTNDGIAAWLNGTAELNEETFAALSASSHPELTNIFPSGAIVAKAGIWDGLKKAYGGNKLFQIATPRKYFKLLLEDTRVVVAEFIELQSGAEAVEQAEDQRHAERD